MAGQYLFVWRPKDRSCVRAYWVFNLPHGPIRDYPDHEDLYGSVPWEDWQELRDELIAEFPPPTYVVSLCSGSSLEAAVEYTSGTYHH